MQLMIHPQKKRASGSCFVNRSLSQWKKAEACTNANTPEAAMCSRVLIGWNPTKGICIDNIKPKM